MDWTRLLEDVAILVIVSGGIAIWYAFQRQMCTAVGGCGNHCGPNILYLLPGLLAVLAGIIAFIVVYRP